jgi:hypothetical protein
MFDVEVHKGDITDEANPALSCKLSDGTQPNFQSAGWLIFFSLGLESHAR